MVPEAEGACGARLSVENIGPPTLGSTVGRYNGLPSVAMQLAQSVQVSELQPGDEQTLL